MEKRVIIGVTGGLATGKTTVADMFAEKGAVRVDADRIAHELLESDEHVISEVIDRFGEGVLAGGKIDRRKLAGRVFGDRAALDDLCGILHPPIIERIRKEIERHKGKPVVIDAPLLIEAGLQDVVDIVVVVTADHDVQVKRAVSRGIPEKEAEDIIKNQMSLSEKVELADYVIDNNADIKKTKEGVDRIWQNA